MNTALEDEHVRRLGTATGQIGRRGERGVLAFEIGLADPTGLRTAASDEDGNAPCAGLFHQLRQRWEAERLERGDVRVLNEQGGIAR